jgi:dolichol-phosphate mannosyltransferase
LTAAIRHTREDWVLLLDSDGQFPIENLPRLIAAVEAAQA